MSCVNWSNASGENYYNNESDNNDETPDTDRQRTYFCKKSSCYDWLKLNFFLLFFRQFEISSNEYRFLAFQFKNFISMNYFHLMTAIIRLKY